MSTLSAVCFRATHLPFVVLLPPDAPMSAEAHMLSGVYCIHRLVQSGPYRLIRHPGESAGGATVACDNADMFTHSSANMVQSV